MRCDVSPQLDKLWGRLALDLKVQRTASAPKPVHQLAMSKTTTQRLQLSLKLIGFLLKGGNNEFCLCARSSLANFAAI